MLIVKHVPGDDNEANIFTKNTSTASMLVMTNMWVWWMVQSSKLRRVLGVRMQ
jgi:hypothetical protein